MVNHTIYMKRKTFDKYYKLKRELAYKVSDEKHSYKVIKLNNKEVELRYEK